VAPVNVAGSALIAFSLFLCLQGCGDEVVVQARDDVGSDILTSRYTGPVRIRPGEVLYDSDESVVATSLLRDPTMGAGKGSYSRSVDIALSIENGSGRRLRLSGIFKPRNGVDVAAPLSPCGNARALPAVIEPGAAVAGDVCFLISGNAGDLVIPGKYFGYAFAVQAG